MPDLAPPATGRAGPFRPAVADLPPAAGPVAAAEIRRRPGGADVRLLHLNESARPPSPAVLAAIQAAAAGGNRYPEPTSAVLAAALAERTGVAADRVAFANGSDELLHACCMITLDPGDEAVMPAPSFPRYRLSTLLMGGRPVPVALAADGANDVAGLAAAIGPRTRLVFCCNPNNPSGGLLPAAALDRLAAAVPPDCLLVVDEAYFEFGRAAGGPDALASLARRTGPWVVLRTFSKAYALAGIRIGYALTDSAFTAAQFRKVRQTFAVSEIAYAAALAALGDPDYSAALIADCRREIARLADGLAALGVKPLPSAANFISADLGRPAQPVIAALAERGILVTDWRTPDYDRMIRITAGTAADTEAVLAALRDLL